MGVFFSYSHDSVAHEQRVLKLASYLVEHGVDVDLDQWVESPPEGWPQWMERRIRLSSYVLIICTAAYCRRASGLDAAETGLAVRFETMLAYQHLFDGNSENRRFIPVIFSSEDAIHIPIPLRGATHYDASTEVGLERLYRRLTDQPSVVKPKLAGIKPMPPSLSDPFDYYQQKHATLPSIERAQLRDFIMNVLISDSDLEAFCLDYYPDTQKRFTGGMDRIGKVNLLLEREETSNILGSLQKSSPERAKRFRHLLDS